MELDVNQLNARFGGSGTDLQALVGGAFQSHSLVPAEVARSLACCIGMMTGAAWRQIAIVGSLRRGGAQVGDLDLLIEGDLRAMGRLLAAAGMQVGGGGGGRLACFAGTFQVDVWSALPPEWGASLLELTGPTGYVIGLKGVAHRKGYDLNRHGLYAGPQRIAGRTEEEIYEALGKAWKPPHLRGL